MRYDLQLRPGMTAIAAVIALSATPAFAQDATQIVTQPPTIVAPPQPEAATAEIVAPTSEAAPLLQQADPAPAQPEIVQAPAPTPVPTMQPIIHQPSAADLQAARIAERAPASPRAASPAPAERVRTDAPAVAAAASVPAPSAPVARTVAPAALPEPAVAAVAPASRSNTATAAFNEDALPYIGAGVAVVVIFGGAAALTRRRRRDEDTLEQRYESDHVLELEPAARVAEPWRAAPVMARAAPVPTAAAALPNGFDLSRFGRHTQAAYRGPTPDNRSLSLRTRLKRASFFDGRERIAAATGTDMAGMPVAAAARTAQAAPAATDRQTVIRPRPAKTGTFFRPSFAQ